MVRKYCKSTSTSKAVQEESSEKELLKDFDDSDEDEGNEEESTEKPSGEDWISSDQIDFTEYM